MKIQKVIKYQETQKHEQIKGKTKNIDILKH